MRQTPSPSLVRRLTLAAAAVVATVVLVRVAYDTVGPNRYAPDFLCFWTAADLMTSGQDPYDPALQKPVHAALGWDKQKNGYGIFELLPFYHAPWVALFVAPLLPLGYAMAKVAWLVLGAEFLVLAGWVLAGRVRGVSIPLAIALVALSGFSVKVVALGQLVPAMLLLVALSWKALDDGRDLLAGALLAASAMKPHLVGVTIAALSLWALRQGRWRVPAGVVAGMAVLLGACTLAYPGWAAGMVAATGATPLPSSYFPGLGVTWLVLLGVLGVKGAAAWIAYGVVAVASLGLLLRVCLDPRSRAADVYGASTIVTFVVAPYARYYDLPMLMLAVLPLVGERIGAPRGGMLALVLLTLPSIQLVWLAATSAQPVPGVTRPEFTFSWVLLLVAALWLYCRADGSRQEPAAATAARG